MCTLEDLFNLTGGYPELRAITLPKLTRLQRLIDSLRKDILLSQPSKHHPSPQDQSPQFLSATVIQFLAEAIDVTPSVIQTVWHVLRDILWDSSAAEVLNEDLESVFGIYGHKKGFTQEVLYPPNTFCLNESCLNSQPLKKAEQIRATIATLDKGTVPAYAIHIYCSDCQTTYHHNFHVRNGIRMYYRGVPNFLQVSGTKFVERRIAFEWTMSMVWAWQVNDVMRAHSGFNFSEFSRTSASNCARLYNETKAELVYPRNHDPHSLSPFLKTEHVWDAFVLLALLQDSTLYDSTLEVPHTGEQSERFKQPMNARNIRIRQQGLPEIYHRCLKCTRYYDNRDSGEGIMKVSVVVTDGITIGHPCCGVHNCHMPLAHHRARFCETHTNLEAVCAVVGCSANVKTGSQVCEDSVHSAAELRHKERGQSRFLLQKRLERANVGPANHTLDDDADVGEEVFDVDSTGTYIVSEDAGPTVCPDKPTSGNTRLRAQFGRKRTHNEQVLHAPCGLILGRVTLFGAEAPSSIKEMIKHFYRNAPHPDHIFYDNNCHLAKVVRGDTFFDHIGLSVDVFHFNCKHSVTDTFCQQHCNPSAFPELLSSSNGWYFNSSIAEQTNVWLGGFHAICREMAEIKYNFFLDEMISYKNRFTLRKLERDGYCPGVWKAEDFYN